MMLVIFICGYISGAISLIICIALGASNIWDDLIHPLRTYKKITYWIKLR